jgi:hypothetical protein
MGDAVFEKFKASKEQTVWYYRSLADVLATRLGAEHRLVARLRREIAIFA